MQRRSLRAYNSRPDAFAGSVPVARMELMTPTFTTDRGDEITVSERLIAKMAERMGRRMSPERRARYMENARRRLAGAHPSRSDAAAVLAAGE